VDQADAGTMTLDRSVRVGIPYHELLAAIAQDRPDLLVMGTKGRSNLADTILGSCAQKMFRRCPIPLLSMRPSEELAGE
jgi:nucleotide-binding universal stress UspA family protein